ncbi:MAG: helix-hairpin-helix domain-containing protein [Firmicutes bacterium]|nr:helix-hairpin-helix domain-containing protein [Bacillota bacterium]
MKELLEDLRSGEPVLDVLMEHKKETIQLAALAVAVLLGLLLYMHQSSADLLVNDEGGSRAVTQEEATSGDGRSEGTGDAAAGRGAGSSDAGITGFTDASGQPLDTDGIVYVDIGGAVKNPMLAELPSGSRVEDAIEAAGGLKKNADMTSVNRAQILTDGEKVYIPEEGESAESGLAGGAGNGSGADGSGFGGGSSGSTPGMVGISGGRININTADVTLLQQLTGVGPVTAQKIVDYREQNGNFQSIEDLKNVSGIGDKTFEKMKDDVTI